MSVKKIIGLFLLWRASLFFIAFLATFLIPKFGGNFPYYDYLLIPTGFPSWVWGFGNFDGVHYLRIALMGYEGSQYSQAFFPLYPLIIKIFDLSENILITALTVSNLLFALSLYVFYQLVRLDYSEKISIRSTILLLLFPTSFFFGAVYSEALFFFLVVSSIFLLRKKSFLAAGLYATLASATRVFGLLLIPVFIIEIYLLLKSKELKQKSSEFIKAVISVILIPLGMIFYMMYLKINFNDPFYFFNSQPLFGAERTSSTVVLLPQVFFRYLKIFITTPLNSLPFFNAFLEFLFTIVPLLIIIWGYKKIRLSYLIFAIGCLIIPTLTGTLSSMPRYTIMTFFTFPFIAEKMQSKFKLLVTVFVALWLILIVLFTRGYWVA